MGTTRLAEFALQKKNCSPHEHKVERGRQVKRFF